jgi:hypothetical protein
MKRLLILICAMALLALSGVAVGATKGKTTHGVAYAGVTHAEGTGDNQRLYVSGDFKDSLLGRGGIVYITKVTAAQTTGEYTVDAKKITIYTAKGSLTGKGSATQVFHEDGSVDVKDGKFALTKGTGKYKGHTFKGTFAGPQTNGVYKFTYDAVYK